MIYFKHNFISRAYRSKIPKKQKKLILVAEFYKSNVAVSKDTLLKVESKEMTENK